MKKPKKYDAVAEVRKIRDELGPKYWNDREFMYADLKRASEEFHRKVKEWSKQRK